MEQQRGRAGVVLPMLAQRQEDLVEGHAVVPETRQLPYVTPAGKPLFAECLRHALRSTEAMRAVIAPGLSRPSPPRSEAPQSMSYYHGSTHALDNT